MNESDRHRTIQGKIAGMTPPFSLRPRESLPTPWPEMNRALGMGGLPRGSIAEFFGPSGAGKTTVALRIASLVQSRGGTAAWIDAEHSFDSSYALSLGVCVERLPVACPESAEQAFEMADRLLATGALDLLVIDSAAALTPALELETPLGRGGAGLHSRALTAGLQAMARAVGRADAVVLFLNQTRSRPETSEGLETTAGGPSLKLHAAVRVSLEPAGARRIRFRILKNKRAVAFGQGELNLLPEDESQECP